MPQHTLRSSAPRPTLESAIEHVVACAPALGWRPADPLNADADAPKALTSPPSGSFRADAASVRPSPNSLSSVLASHPAAPLTSSPPPTARSSCQAPGLPACCCSAAGAACSHAIRPVICPGGVGVQLQPHASHAGRAAMVSQPTPLSRASS